MRSLDSVHPLDQLRAVLTRWPLVVLVTALVTATALAVSLRDDKQYDATAKLLVGSQGEPINNLLEPNTSAAASDPERDVDTGVEVIKAGGTARVALRRLGLRRSVDEVLEQIDIDSSTSSGVVSLRARDRSPLLAARIANAFAQSYVDFRLNSARKRYQQAAELAGAQLETLSDEERAAPEGRALQARRRELQIAGALQTGGAEIIRRASPPTKPSRPRPALSGGLGVVLGLALGAAAALLLGFADRRLTSEEEIEAFFDLPILGTIPPPARRTSSPEEHLQREAFGLLAANLRFKALSEPGVVLMITSAGPREGKSSVTLGLARALTQLGNDVIAIEADLRRPSFGQYLNLPTGVPGLDDVLSGRVRLTEALLSIDVETMSLAPARSDVEGSFQLLAAGVIPAEPQRILSSPALHSTLAMARQMADVVLVDTAPIGTVNDAAGLLHVVDSTAIIVRVGVTTKDAARRALRLTQNVNVNLAGLVLTDTAAARAPDYYYVAETDNGRRSDRTKDAPKRERHGMRRSK